MQDASHDTPTKPENASPEMAAIGRLEGKVDMLVGMVQRFFEELNQQRAEKRLLEERVDLLEHGARKFEERLSAAEPATHAG